MATERRVAIVLACAIWTLVSLPDLGNAHGYKKAKIEIVHPWCRDAFEPETRDVVVGMDIKNVGKQKDRLLRAESAVASTVELRNLDGASPRNFDILAGGRVSLSRKATYLRLIGVTKTLVAYDTLPVTLVFEKAGRIAIDVLVEEWTEVKQ